MRIELHRGDKIVAFTILASVAVVKEDNKLPTFMFVDSARALYRTLLNQGFTQEKIDDVPQS